MSGPPAQLLALRERAEVTAALERVGALLFWDQNTMMPPAGAAARGDHLAALQRVLHERLTDPATGRLLDALEPWVRDADPDAEDTRFATELRRDFEKAVRVPTSLAAELSRAAALGQAAWQEARAADDFGRERDALERHLELRHAYIACFPDVAHPYDVLLDDFEPGMTTARIQPLMAELTDALVPLVAAAQAGDDRPRRAPLGGPHPAERQRMAVMDLLEGVGLDPDGWRLDVAPHPFAQGIGPGDVRITTRYDVNDVASAVFGALHEFGHGLYEAQIPARLAGGPLGSPVSLGVHESQSRLWENFVGRSEPFCRWALPRLTGILGAAEGLTAERLYHDVNVVRRSLIRVEADETTYNLHIALRLELELALVEGTLTVDGLPTAWNEGMHRLLGLDVPDDAQGVLQDVHWGAGLFGYFPTYSLGNLMAAQLWGALRRGLPDLDEQITRGEFAELREWLGRHIHAHGRARRPDELLRAATGEELGVAPFLRYLREKLADTGALGPA